MDNNTERRPYTFDRVVRILFSICGIVAVIFLLDILKDVLLPFLVACLIAYMLEPIVQWNKKWMHTSHRLFPIIFTFFEVIAALSIAGYFFVPYMIDETAQMTTILKQYASAKMSIPFVPDNIHSFIRKYIDFRQITSFLSKEQWLNLIERTLSSSWSFLSSGLNLVIAVVGWLIVVLYLIFIMLDYDRLTNGFKQLVPVSHRKQVFRILEDVKNAMNHYFRGQTLIASIVGILFSIGFLIIGLPMGVVLGLFIGMLNMVPYLQLVSIPITAVLCLVCSVDTGIDFWTISIKCLIVYAVVQIIQDLILTPKIMGKTMGLNPAIILLSLSVWGCLLGFMGMIIALPLTTLILSYYDRYVVKTSRSERKIQSNTKEKETLAEGNDLNN